MAGIQPLTPLTLQEQLKAHLTRSINDGVYKPGDKIPSENQLVKTFGVSRVTVRAALAQLVEDGILVKRQGKGAYVKPTAYRETVFSNGSFTDTCLKINAVPSTRILSVGEAKVDAELVGRLNLHDPSSGHVIRIERLRLVDGVPCILEVDYFPSAFTFLLNIELSDRSLLHLINEQTGRVPTQFIDHFYIDRATAEQAATLECKRGTALLKVEQTVADARQTPIYINHQFIVTERYVYAVQSNK